MTLKSYVMESEEEALRLELKTDPAVIRYNLDEMRVAWGRIEMPWYAWDPAEDTDPLETARGGKLNDRVGQAMEMARDPGITRQVTMTTPSRVSPCI